MKPFLKTTLAWAFSAIPCGILWGIGCVLVWDMAQGGGSTPWLAALFLPPVWVVASAACALFGQGQWRTKVGWKRDMAWCALHGLVCTFLLGCWMGYSVIIHHDYPVFWSEIIEGMWVGLIVGLLFLPLTWVVAYLQLRRFRFDCAKWNLIDPHTAVLQRKAASRWKVVAWGTALAVGQILFVQAYFYWEHHTYTRQDIRVDTGEIREVHEGVFWNSSPENIHETSVTAVLRKHGIGMKPQGDPWVYFNRVHTYIRMSGEIPLEDYLFMPNDGAGNLHCFHIHYDMFLDAVARHRSPEEAALWWKALMTPTGDWQKTRYDRWHGFHDMLRDRENPFVSRAEFDAWYANEMDFLRQGGAPVEHIPLFGEIDALYKARQADHPPAGESK